MTNDIQNQGWQEPPPLNERAIVLGPCRPWVRYMARSIDNFIFQAMVAILIFVYLKFLSADASTEASFLLIRSFGLAMLAPYFIEMICLSTLGTTPGKTLLNISLRNEDGSKLSFAQSFRRTSAIWIRGGYFAYFIPYFIGGGICSILMIYQCIRLEKNKITSWDSNQNLTYTHGPIGTMGIVSIVIFVITYLSLNLWLLISTVGFIMKALGPMMH